MKQITRRKFLRNTAAAGAVGATIAAPAAVEAAAEMTASELPVTRVNRIAWELSRAMDDWCNDSVVGCGPDAWKAHIYPASYTSCPVSFEQLDLRVVPSRPVHDLAIWHMRELERLTKDAGMASASVILVGHDTNDGGEGRCRCLILSHTGEINDEDRIFRRAI